MSQLGNTPPACIRSPRPGDQSFVASTWVRSLLRRGSSYDKRLARPHEEMVNAILDRGDTRVLIRHSPTDENEIRAWLAYAVVPRVTVIHWTYCRKQFRERGYATQLLQAVGITTRTVVVYTAMPQGQAGRRLITMYPASTMIPIQEFLTGETK